MTYELALELKNAGFKQTGIHSPLTYSRGEGEPYHPYLDELIEACGEGFHSLHKVGVGFRADGRKVTDIPKDMAERDKMSIIEIGSTPEEAVSNLWLAINKK